MSQTDFLVASFAALFLFIHGLQSISLELQMYGLPVLRPFFERYAKRRVAAFLIGALTTAIVQSSSAVSAIACALVNSHALRFRAALAILIGANVGTTATAWLVAFKLTSLGAWILVLGGILSLIPTKLKPVGKTVFFLGLVLFALDLVSANLKPLLGQPWVTDALRFTETPLLGVLVGLVLTAILQSSSAVVGLTVVMASGGGLSTEAAIAVVVGSNVGSTSTALLGSLGMDQVARAAAFANTGFNLCGLIVFLPFLAPFSGVVKSMVPDPSSAVATAHLVFNVVTGTIFLLALHPAESWLRARFGISEER